jgi:hypothetical protein
MGWRNSMLSRADKSCPRPGYRHSLSLHVIPVWAGFVWVLVLAEKETMSRIFSGCLLLTPGRMMAL